MTGEPPAGAEQEDEARPARRFPSSRVSAADRVRMREGARDVAFPIALRGYDRDAVDRYVEQVNRLIAELEMSASPESAVRHALEEVSEEMRELLQRAHETADEITARSRAQADDRLQRAEREAQETRAEAEREAQGTREAAQREAQDLRERSEHESRELRESAARQTEQVRATAQREVEQMREAAEGRAEELDRHAQLVRRECRHLLGDMRMVGEQLLELADAEAARFAPVAEAAAEEVVSAGEGEQLAATNEPSVPPETPDQG
jgi:DivIVA domain-containing protein